MIDVLLAAAIALAQSPAPTAPPGIDVYAWEVGDDNQNGFIEKDESGWDCTTMGNRICGVGNANGVPAGLYDTGGVLVDAWPLG